MMFFIFLQETPFPSPAPRMHGAAGGSGVAEGLVRQDERAESHLFWTLRECWQKEKGDTFRAGLRGRAGVRLPSWVRMLLKCLDEPRTVEAHRPLGRLPAVLGGRGRGRRLLSEAPRSRSPLPACVSLQVPASPWLVLTERTMGRAFGHKKGTTTASSFATGAMGASWSPSEAGRIQAQPCSHLAKKQPRPTTMRRGPARTPMTPCGPSPAPPAPDTSHLPRGLPGSLPEQNRP